MEHLYSFLVSLFVLGVLIFVHELGHFLLAKACGVGVIEFALGFGKKVWSRRRGKTDYSLRIIPLGGYVRMAGDDPHAVLGDPDAPNRAESVLTGADPNNIAERERFSDQSQWFLKKNLWARVAIVLAGPVFNLVFAWFLAVGSYAVFGKAKETNEPVIGGVFPKYPADNAGIKEGDRFLTINGQGVSNWVDLAAKVKNSGGEEMRIVIERKDGSGIVEKKEFALKGTLDTADIELLHEPESPDKPAPPPSYKIGIVPQLGRQPVGVGEALLQGTDQIMYLCSLTFRVFGALVTGVVAPSKVIGGPIAVITGAAQSAKRGIESIIDFMVLLSVSLFIFNLLPVPILDGGHLLFFLIEGLRGKPLGLRWIAIANNVGMFLLLSLMAFAVSNDILRLF